MSQKRRKLETEADSTYPPCTSTLTVRLMHNGSLDFSSSSKEVMEVMEVMSERLKSELKEVLQQANEINTSSNKYEQFLREAEAVYLRDPNQEGVKFLRHNIPIFRRICYLKDDIEKNSTVKATWSERPIDWPADLIHVDPNNPGSASAKPTKPDLIKMFLHLIKTYKSKRESIWMAIVGYTPEDKPVDVKSSVPSIVEKVRVPTPGAGKSQPTYMMQMEDMEQIHGQENINIESEGLTDGNVPKMVTEEPMVAQACAQTYLVEIDGNFSETGPYNQNLIYEQPIPVQASEQPQHVKPDFLEQPNRFNDVVLGQPFHFDKVEPGPSECTENKENKNRMTACHQVMTAKGGQDETPHDINFEYYNSSEDITEVISKDVMFSWSSSCYCNGMDISKEKALSKD